MSIPAAEKLRRYEIGGLPLVEAILCRMGLREILAEALDLSGREAISSVEILTLLVMNLAVAKDPLYELAEWIDAFRHEGALPHKEEALLQPALGTKRTSAESRT
ncbi:MAG: DUF4277 domain-containing protein [bacterium]